jgi:hypothetical protein
VAGRLRNRKIEEIKIGTRRDGLISLTNPESCRISRVRQSIAWEQLFDMHVDGHLTSG